MIKDIIDKWLAGIEIDLVKNYDRLGLRASGNWAKQLEPFQKEESNTLTVGMLGEKYTGALENGRTKTMTTTASDPTLLEQIIQWVKDKNIRPYDNISEKSMIYLITRKIHEEGIKVPNRYNSGGLISDVVTKSKIQELNRSLSLFYIDGFRSDVIKELK